MNTVFRLYFAKTADLFSIAAKKVSFGVGLGKVSVMLLLEQAHRALRKERERET
jgi:hypothetical protein